MSSPTPRAGAKRLQPRRRPSQERSRETVDAILEATVQVFTQVGHDQGTIARIAARAGVSAGTLYQYFPGKDAIIIALMDRHATATAERITAMTAATDDARPTLATAVQAFVRTMLEVYTHHPLLIRVLFETVPRTTAVQQRQAEVMAEVARHVAAFLRGFPEVAVPDLTMASEMIVSLVDAQTRAFALLPMFTAPLDQLEAELGRLVCRYLTGQT
jgi:AcrR family transcriptional regulator